MKTKALLFSVFLASSAFAQNSDPALATELFKQARDAVTRGDFATACPKFEESLRLDAKVGTAINLADCEEKLGQIAGARGHLQRAIDLARASNDDRLSLAQERFAAIDKRVPRLTVKLAPGAAAAASIKRDAVTLGTATLGTALPVDPGKHVIVVTAAGYADRSFDVTLKEGESKTLEVSTGDPVAPPVTPPLPNEQQQPPATVVTEQQVPDKSQRSPIVTAGFVVGGVGLATIAGGIVAGLIAIERNSASNQNGLCDATGCTPEGIEIRNAARTAGDVATVLWIAGGILTAGGVVMVLAAPKSTNSARLEIRPTVGGLWLTGRF